MKYYQAENKLSTECIECAHMLHMSKEHKLWSVNMYGTTHMQHCTHSRVKSQSKIKSQFHYAALVAKYTSTGEK